MARILITSGPTRQYLDPVRFLTNASSGRMGRALTQTALNFGHEVVVVSGPVEIAYPAGAEVISVVTTEQMLAVCRQVLPSCDGIIGVAAPCDYRPVQVEDQKITKTGRPLVLHLIETSDIVATLAEEKDRQWIVGFALETEDRHFRAITKLEKKRCDLIVLNGPEAMNSAVNNVEIMDRAGQVIRELAGTKDEVANGIFAVIQARLIEPSGG
jgi:phosphopantothenoylcysteine decarboxylase/phosphopantothenate--cysteine ligase